MYVQNLPENFSRCKITCVHVLLVYYNLFIVCTYIESVIKLQKWCIQIRSFVSNKICLHPLRKSAHIQEGAHIHVCIILWISKWSGMVLSLCMYIHVTIRNGVLTVFTYVYMYRWCDSPQFPFNECWTLTCQLHHYCA